MSALILKSVNHVYRIFKVYLTLALCGILAVIGVELVLSNPLALVISVIAIISLLMGILLWVQAHKLRFSINLNERFRTPHRTEPPKLPESVMAVAVPASEREVIIGDLREQFWNLDKKYGKASATTWYIVQTALFVCHLSTIRKYKAKIEGATLRFVMFVLYLYAMYELLESHSNITQVLGRFLR